MKKIINPRTRMRYENPWLVWKALRMLRSKEIMYKDRAGLLHSAQDFYAPDSIARQLYRNWEDLEKRDQELVILSKIRFPLVFLKYARYVREKWEIQRPQRSDRSDRPVQVWLGSYQAVPGVFLSMEHMAFDQKVDLEKATLNSEWRKFRGARV